MSSGDAIIQLVTFNKSFVNGMKPLVNRQGFYLLRKVSNFSSPMASNAPSTESLDLSELAEARSWEALPSDDELLQAYMASAML